MDSSAHSVIPAAMWTWFWLTFIMFGGVWILRGGAQKLIHINPHAEALRYNIARLPFIILFASMVVFSFLIFSQGFSSWFGTYVDFTIPGVRDGLSLFILFIVNAVLVSYLVALTGGSISSPFTPMFFILPPLAIFLRVANPWLTAYGSMVVFLFLLMLFTSQPLDAREHRSSMKFAYAVISVMCLALTVFIGSLQN